MANDILAIKDKVQRYIVDWAGSAQVDRDGDFFIRYGSSTIFLSVKPFGDDSSIVRVFSVTNREVPASPELFEFIATSSYWFGNLLCTCKDGLATVMFSHTLLGDFLDPEELKTAVAMVGLTADKLDDTIAARFGGTPVAKE